VFFYQSVSACQRYCTVFLQTDIGGDIVDWDEDGWGKYDSVASFNPYQSDLAPLEVGRSHFDCSHFFAYSI
jgi:hypothetical protein